MSNLLIKFKRYLILSATLTLFTLALLTAYLLNQQKSTSPTKPQAVIPQCQDTITLVCSPNESSCQINANCCSNYCNGGLCQVAPTPTPTPSGTLFNTCTTIQAESGSLTNWTIGSDAGRNYIQSRTGSVARYNINIPTIGSYGVKGMVYGATTGDDSFLLTFGTTSDYAWHFGSTALANWAEITVGTTFNFNQVGTYTLTLSNREDGARIDYLQVYPSSGCGSTPTPTPTPRPSSTATPTPTPTRTPTPTPSAAVNCANNIASAGTGYRWSMNTSSSANTNQVTTSVVKNGDVTDEVGLNGGTDDTVLNAWEAAGITWATSQSGVTRVEFTNGSYDGSYNGVFDANFKLQYSISGTSWLDVSNWSYTPSYSYNSSSAANRTYVFTGAALNDIRGIRITGQVHTSDTAAVNSWQARAREIKVCR